MVADIGWTVVSKGESVRKASSFGPYLISICFGLLAVCGLIIALLFQEIKDMKVEIARQKQQLSATEVRIGRLERASQQQIAKDPRILAPPPRHDAISLSIDDVKTIRSFIKVPPTKPGTQQKRYVGEEVSDFRSVPLPDSLVSQIPKLRGARFVVDNNGAILLFGEGSTHVDAVVEP